MVINENEIKEILEKAKVQSISEFMNDLNIATQNLSLKKKEKYYKLIIIEFKILISDISKRIVMYPKDERQELKYLKKNLEFKLANLKSVHSEYKKELKKLEKENVPKNMPIIEEKEDKKITTEEIIEDKIKLGEEISSYELKEKIQALANVVKESEASSLNDIEQYLEEIKYELFDYLNETKEVFSEFCYLLDVLKSKMRSYDKGTEEREIVRQIFHGYKDIYTVYQKSSKEKKTVNPYFDIIDYWLQDEDNFIYINQLFKTKPYLRNLRHEGKHIVVHILDLYIENYKKMLEDKNSDYINKDYLKEVYFLLTKTYFASPNGLERQEIDEKLKEFSIYIKNTIIKQKRKMAALNDIKKLKTSHYYVVEKHSDVAALYTIEHLNYFSNSIMQNVLIGGRKGEAIDVTVLNGVPYSIKEENDEIKLSMYAMNLSNFILTRSGLLNYLEGVEYGVTPLSSFVSDKFVYEKNTKYPAFKYTLIFGLSGKIKGMELEKVNINVKDKYVSITNLDETINSIMDLYKTSSIKNNLNYKYDANSLNEYFEDILTDQFVDFVCQNHLPFIFCGSSMEDEKDKYDNVEAISKSLYYLPKKDSSDIVEILTTSIDKYHYSLYPIKNGKYDLRLLDPLNYIGIENQRMINDLYFNQRGLESKVRLDKLKLLYLGKFVEEVTSLNKQYNYVDSNDLKAMKGKLKRKFRI